MLNANLVPLPNAPFGCNFSLANFNPASPDPNDPNHCYVAAVSPSTYWREELFRIDQTLSNKGARFSFRYVHDAWDTTVLTPQWNYLSITDPRGDVPHHPEPLLWAGDKPGGAADAAHIEHTAE